jgi:hypothetical protein
MFFILILNILIYKYLITYERVPAHKEIQKFKGELGGKEEDLADRTGERISTRKFHQSNSAEDEGSIGQCEIANVQ